MARSLLASTLVGGALISLPTPALALGDTIWFNCRNGEPVCGDEQVGLFDEVVDVWEGMGASVVVTTEITEDITSGDVRLLVIYLPTQSFGPPVFTAYLPSFLASGGRVVFIGEHAGEAGPNGVISGLLGTIPDNPLRLGGTDTNNGCAGNESSGGQIVADPLTAGVTSWRYARVNTVEGGDPLIRFDRSDGGTGTLAAVYRPPAGGEVVLIGDSEGFAMNCTDNGVDFSATNAAFWQALFGEESTPVDTDADGYLSDVDCDDGNPFVFPGAEEECNGIDDDCDDTIDEGCGDDDDDDATADDDDASDDDDDASDDDDVFGDDDDDGFNRRPADPGGCSCTNEGGSAAAMLLLPLLGGPLRRRR